MESDPTKKLSGISMQDSKIVELALMYKKGDKIPVNFVNENAQDGDLFSIVLNGVNIGEFSLQDKNESDIREIGNISLNSNFQGKGIGKQIYIMLNDYLNTLDGSVLGSAEKTTLDSDNLWNSLYKDGLVEKNRITAQEKPRYKFKK